jgi:hypothetical protein
MLRTSYSPDFFPCDGHNATLDGAFPIRHQCDSFYEDKNIDTHETTNQKKMLQTIGRWASAISQEYLTIVFL